jgi:hypothetical protein
MKIKLAAVLIGIFLAPLPAFPHHSFASQFDASKPVTVQGTVAKVEWTNPHSWLYVDVKDESGKVTRWQCELASPNQLKRQGWTRNTIKAGDQLTIQGSRARKDETTCYARVVRNAEGKRVLGEDSPGQ